MEWLLRVALGLYCCIILSGCDLATDQIDTLPVLHQVSPVDSSPGKLAVKVLLNEDQNALDGKAALELQFMDVAIRNPNDVQFTDRETINCNGVPLTYDITSYTYDADILSTSNNYRCLYTSHGRTSVLAVPVQTQLSPTYILSGGRLNVHYEPNDEHVCTVQVEATDSLHILNGPAHPDDGLYATMDVSDLSGSGKLQFMRTCHAVHPSAFYSVNVNYQASRSIDVAWHNVDK